MIVTYRNRDKRVFDWRPRLGNVLQDVRRWSDDLRKMAMAGSGSQKPRTEPSGV